MAAWLLRAVGLATAPEGPGAAMTGDVDRAVADAGLPAGTFDYAAGAALALGALAGWRAGEVVEVPEAEVAHQLRLPEGTGGGQGRPGRSRPAPGGGLVHADLGRPGDEEDFATVLELHPGADAADLARAAQEWRLPVCDYRPRPPAPALVSPYRVDASGRGRPMAGRPRRPLAGVTVCELTNMWAGPLASRLLAGYGATVVRIEPASRPDGFRAVPALWDALNGGKDVEDLDLRLGPDRDRFVAVAGGADLVVDSFAPRVMPNFGLERRILAGRGRPTRLSLPAFGPGPERDWVAYGGGVHAVLGLGDEGGTWAEPAVSYPDPVSGYVTAVGAAAAILARDRGAGPSRIRTSLAEATAPLLAFNAAGG